MSSSMSRMRDWVFSVPFLIAFGSILAVFDPLQRVARLFGPRPHEIVVGALQACLLAAFRLCGTRVDVERSERVRKWTPYILVSNHQSMFDVPIFGALLFSNFPKYVAKRELARWIPSISYNLRRGGNAIIDRGDSSQAVTAIRELGATLAVRRVSAVIFPEGTRSRAGGMGNFRPRGTLELLDAAPAVEVVAVTIDESWKLLRDNLLPVPFGTRVRVRIGDPVARAPKDGAHVLRLAESDIRATLERWRNDRGAVSATEPHSA